MNSVTVIHVGDFKEKYFKDAENEYIKRLKAFCDYKTVCIKEESSFGEDSEKLIARALEKEAAAIRAAVPKQALKIAMCIEGKQLSSTELAEVFAKESRPICFIIGSSFGLDESLKRECDMKLSMSKMTFPHMLARVMLAEQVYRANAINAGKKYHK
ncbi:MAG: 23S rRNA (pseudouridine(1915)-N(3))-methyltransferase RlmH [Clostridia bacterium]|nr:23S rRNA (pseudouridine(1915)-N(3))-methyltransferase RlmH [Clostridia bacterium]MBQ9848781.1 23S rRNA (pseudouridine(1915)-N(3))-methyltransferase RlmH [Clostridia bacterium]